jgi:C4-dicarboxylate-binding protein DctP
VYIPTPAENAAWKKAMWPVHKQMESRIGEDLIKKIYAESAALGFK